MIPVNSQDEIGELANAYNMMVYKLKDLQEELAETERQSAWTEMARQVAHEIKNPLTPMKLSIQHLYQQVEYGEKTIEEVRPMVRKIAGTLIQEIDSLSNIASDFSKFARPIVEEFQDIPLNSMVSEVIELHRHDNRIEIFFDAGSSHVVVHAAVDEFKRVLINLIKNSVEAVGATGVVLIRTYDYEKQAFVEIVDNGCGMSRELQQKVFIPNFSTKNAGTGLGLAISKKIIDAHKGTIQCASAPGLGTTFSISLPLVLE
jgi:nitrogen fixation/metabolism regulation signal transduction histidine kinase